MILVKPVIRSTCLMVDLLLRNMSEGATAADSLRMYPQLEVALAYELAVLVQEKTIGSNA